MGLFGGDEEVRVVLRAELLDADKFDEAATKLDGVKASTDQATAATERHARAGERQRSTLQAGLGIMTMTNSAMNRMGLLSDSAAQSMNFLIGTIQTLVAAQRLLKLTTDAETGSQWANAAGRAAAWVAANPLFAAIVIGAIGATVAAVAAAKATGALAQGGIVMPPGGVFQVAEAGTPEAVIPLDRPEARRMLGGGGTVNNIQLVGDARMWDSELRSLME